MIEKKNFLQSVDHREKILIVDDEESILRILNRILSDAGYESFTTRGGEEALEMIEADPSRFAAVFLDLKLPGIGGMEVLRRLRLQYPEIEVIIITGYGTIELAVEAVRIGAFDFLTKPFESNEKIVITLGKALEHRELVKKVKRWEESEEKEESFCGLIGKSPKMRTVYQLIEKLAPIDTVVLIQGESGTGKELVAKALHNLSPRRKNRFVAVNCSAITESLFESELFGHEKGSFTGAANRRIGLYEVASGGTLFLDEVSEIPIATQAKLLRAIQEGEIRRVGGNESIKVDSRIVAATNQDLAKLCSVGKFREDLYYRLHVVTLLIPPLRERSEDIPLLANYFVNKICKKFGISVKKISPSTMKILLSYPWWGNVRELENAMEHAVVISQGEEIIPKDLPNSILKGELKVVRKASVSQMEGWENFSYREAKREALRRFHQAYFKGLLSRTGGNLSQAARLAQLDRSNFRRIMKSAEISIENKSNGSNGTDEKFQKQSDG